VWEKEKQQNNEEASYDAISHPKKGGKKKGHPGTSTMPKELKEGNLLMELGKKKGKRGLSLRKEVKGRPASLPAKRERGNKVRPSAGASRRESASESCRRKKKKS